MGQSYFTWTNKLIVNGILEEKPRIRNGKNGRRIAYFFLVQPSLYGDGKTYIKKIKVLTYLDSVINKLEPLEKQTILNCFGKICVNPKNNSVFIAVIDIDQIVPYDNGSKPLKTPTYDKEVNEEDGD